VADAAPANDWTTPVSWDFAPLDDDAFPAVNLARSAGTRGGTAPAVFNAANEECVEAFLAGHLGFTDIVDTVAAVLADDDGFVVDPTLDDVLAAEDRARHAARDRIGAVVA
jgi:1-deoxy-D-xylulose-5-phosphate reductoisomerase